MKHIFLLLVVSFVHSSTSAQRNKQVSIAFMNTNSAMPFGKLGGLITNVYHPGFELGYGYNLRTKPKHDWFHELKVGYFYHRFVQHGIPLYTDIGYRYKFSPSLTADAALGAGYMHSVPATGLYKLQEDGTYKDHKGVGRAQAIATLGMGAGYVLNSSAPKPIKLFLNYQQRLQFPFVKSYVPLLPYNSLLIGASVPLKNNHNK